MGLGSLESKHWSTDGMRKHDRYRLVIEHPDAGQTVVVGEGDTHVIGRSPDCHTTIPDKKLSGLHVAFAVVDGILWCLDLKSRNGVSYRGRQIEGRRPVETNYSVQIPGALIQIQLP